MILGRLGRMAYLNTLPVDWGLVTGPLGRFVAIQRGAPTTLNRFLAEGLLDVSPVSSVAAAEHAEDWLVLGNVCIASRGEVGSVILHSNRPVEDLAGRSIAVTGESATAARLLEVLLNEHWKVDAELVPGHCPAEARLLIGDSALKTAQSRPSGLIYDLGAAWKDYSGMDFVFGLWCVRRKFARTRSDETRALSHLLRCSYSLGRVEAAKVEAEAARVAGLPLPVMRDYYRKLVYELDDGLWSGLKMFLRLIGSDPDRLEIFEERMDWPSRQCA